MRELYFFFKRRLPWSSPLKAFLFKMFALASFKKKTTPKLRRDMSLDCYMIYVCTKTSDWIWGIQTEMQTASSGLWSFAVFYFKKVWSSDIACFKTPRGAFFPSLSDSYTLPWCSLARNPSACGQWCKCTSCLWRTTLNPAGGRSLPRASLSSAA